MNDLNWTKIGVLVAIIGIIIASILGIIGIIQNRRKNIEDGNRNSQKAKALFMSDNEIEQDNNKKNSGDSSQSVKGLFMSRNKIKQNNK
ncbi:hypothetical protein QJK96_07355 [Clostridioides difficile]|nr:hypothetical protein [Clostridioides difficile]